MRFSYVIKYHTFASVASYLRETSSFDSSHLRYDAEEFWTTVKMAAVSFSDTLVPIRIVPGGM